MNTAADNIESAKRAIVALAGKCVEALTSANFAGREGMDDVSRGLRKLAAMHAADAWAWVPHLRPGTIVRGNADLVPCTHASLGGHA